jgi:hypothetical protein
MMKTLVVAATAMVLAAPALAQTPAAPPASPPADAKAVDHFAKADGNKDGSLTIAEVKLADPAVTQADFDTADADKSKALSKAEFDKWAMAKKPADKASAPGQ